MRKFKVLVVDDDAIVLEALAAMVDQLGAKAVPLTGSRAAAWRAEVEAFDAVFTDLNMPVLTGVELIRRVRASKLNAQTPIAIVTAAGGKAIQEALTAGANFFLEKPMTLRSVADLMKQIRGHPS